MDDQEDTHVHEFRSAGEEILRCSMCPAEITEEEMHGTNLMFRDQLPKGISA